MVIVNNIPVLSRHLFKSLIVFIYMNIFKVLYIKPYLTHLCLTKYNMRVHVRAFVSLCEHCFLLFEALMKDGLVK